MLSLNFSPFPILETARLILRQILLSDEKEIFLLRNDSRVNEFIGRPKNSSIEDIRTFIEKISSNTRNNESILWGISLKENPALIGTICLWNFSIENFSAEVGYELMPEFQGRGLMQEAVEKILLFGFNELGLHTIDAFIHHENKTSIRLSERNNFIFRKAHKSEPGLMIYTLQKENFHAEST